MDILIYYLFHFESNENFEIEYRFFTASELSCPYTVREKMQVGTLTNKIRIQVPTFIFFADS